MSRRRREVTGEEQELWEIVTETVAPLAPAKHRPRAKKVPDTPPKPKEKSAKAASPSPSVPIVAPKPRPPAPPSLHPIDRRTRTRLARGTVAIDARIDLHGMTQVAAEERLRRFLHRAQDDGAKVVLVITGKGKPGAGGEERGVLRRVVPLWLASPALRGIVVGFDEAGPTHGGAGALYVRIRRIRG